MLLLSKYLEESVPIRVECDGLRETDRGSYETNRWPITLVVSHGVGFGRCEMTLHMSLQQAKNLRQALDDAVRRYKEHAHVQRADVTG